MNGKQFDQVYRFSPRLAAVLAVLSDEPEERWTRCVEEGHRLSFGPPLVCAYDCHLDTPVRPVYRPEEAWELLATRDLIPLSWIDHPRRFGVLGPEPCGDCPRWGKPPPLCTMCDDTRLFASALSPHPATLAELVAFASLDPEAVERAELLAAEAIQHQRAAAWRFGTVDHEPHGTERRVQALRAINELGLGTGQTRRGSALAPYAILVCPPL